MYVNPETERKKTEKMEQKYILCIYLKAVSLYIGRFLLILVLILWTRD